jgi:endoglucanase
LKKISFRISSATLVAVLSVAWLVSANPLSPSSLLQVTPQDALETHGLSAFLFHNSYDGVFGDEKMSGLEIIFHEQPIATNGDVRLSPTPAQWDPIPRFKNRKRGASPNELVASLAYPDKDLSYRIAVQPEDGGIRVAVLLDRALPNQFAGKAGFNLEFLPNAYFGKSYLVDDSSGMFPRLSTGPMEKDSGGAIEPVALASGHKIVLSPENPLTRVSITSDGAPLQLFDGRNQAQKRLVCAAREITGDHHQHWLGPIHRF